MAVATWKQHEHIIEYLLQNGADIHCRNTNRGGQQPIHLASIMGNERIIQILISYGANLDNETTSNGATTPIELAARLGHKNLVENFYQEHSKPIGKLLPYSFLSNNPEVSLFIY